MDNLVTPLHKLPIDLQKQFKRAIGQAISIVCEEIELDSLVGQLKIALDADRILIFNLMPKEQYVVCSKAVYDTIGTNYTQGLRRIARWYEEVGRG